MKRTGAIFSAVAGLSLICGAATALPLPLPEAPRRLTPAPTAASQARLTWVDGTEFEFGDIWDHEPVHHDFWFVNDGKDPLSIERFQPTCGCTLGGIYKADGTQLVDSAEAIQPGTAVIQPGEKGYVQVVFNPSGRRGDQHKTVKLFTNASNGRQTDIRFTANVEPVLIFDPPLIHFTGVPKGQSETQTLTIAGRSPDFEVKLKEYAGDEHFKIEVGDVKPVEIDDETFYQAKIDVTILPGVKVGREIGELLFETNDPRREELDLRIVARVLGDLTGRPPRLALGAKEAGEEFDATFDVLSKSATPFKIKDVKITGSLTGAKAEFAPLQTGGNDAYRVTFHATPNASSRQSGMVQIYTNLEDEPMIEIPYSAWIRQNADAQPTRRIDVPSSSVRTAPATNVNRVTPTQQKTTKKGDE